MSIFNAGTPESLLVPTVHPGVYMEELVTEDAADFLAMVQRNEDRLSEFGSALVEFYTDLEETEATLADAQQLDGFTNLGIKKGKAELIGQLEIAEHPVRKDVCTLGYMVDKAHTGQGYGRAALEAAIPVAYRRYRHLTLEIHPANTPSIGLAQSAGFKPERRALQDGTLVFLHHAT